MSKEGYARVENEFRKRFLGNKRSPDLITILLGSPKRAERNAQLRARPEEVSEGKLFSGIAEIMQDLEPKYVNLPQFLKERELFSGAILLVDTAVADIIGNTVHRLFFYNTINKILTDREYVDLYRK